MIDHCQDKGFAPFLPMGHVFVGGALAADGALAEGAARMTEGIEGLARSRTAYTVPTFHAWLAAVCQEQGDVARARAARADGMAMAKAMGDVFMRPEFARIDGELLRIEGKAAEAEAAFRQAIESAEGAHASSLALRATMSLTRLRHDQGNGGQAAEQLAAMLARFDEGFATPDLREAKALLDELR
jgi:predicted ATPase